MSRPEWYIARVQTGEEDRVCRLITQACQVADQLSHQAALAAAATDDLNPATAGPTLRDCFSPIFRTQKKLRGQWITVERPLMPGYAILVTASPARVRDCARQVRGFYRILRMEETYIPLTPEERSWLEHATQDEGDKRVVPMSFGYLDGNRVVATSGPLVGHEGIIVKIKRSASLAFLEFHVGTKRIKTTIGLGIVPEDRAKQEAQAL